MAPWVVSEANEGGDRHGFVCDGRPIKRLAAGAVLPMVFRGEIVPLIDLKPALEYRGVALRPEHVGASALSKREIIELIEAVEALSEPVDVVARNRPLSLDPNDDMILELAIDGRTEILVTSNKKHFVAAGKRFGVSVLSPAELLQRMTKGQ